MMLPSQKAAKHYAAFCEGGILYAGNTALIEHYINPLLGNYYVKDVNAKAADRLVGALQKTPPVETPWRKARTEYLTPSTIEKIFKLLHCAWQQAIRWDMALRNPFEHALLPKKETKQRDIWNAETIRSALAHCPAGNLFIAINLAFACSLRLGEITGLTWDCVHISDRDIANDNAYLFVEKELSRVDQKAIAALGRTDILFTFPQMLSGKSTTRLVLKRPKTQSSIRKVWIPKTLAYILRDWQKQQEQLKLQMAEAYTNYHLVLALKNGRPCEDRVIGNQFERLKKNANLPDVVFHSLRHSSTTYKLKLNHGDIKATQGDTGHSQAQMVTEVYAHILDEERRTNAQRFDEAFYAKPDIRKIKHESEAQESTPSAPEIQALLTQLQQHPELLHQLKTILTSS